MKFVLYLCLFKTDTGSEKSVAAVILQLQMASSIKDSREEQEAFNGLDLSFPLPESIF